jgi:hypothetical protein
MARRRHPRTAADSPPEVLRFDLRLTSAHPRLQSWAFRRPFTANPMLKEALEKVLEIQGEDGLDYLLSVLATDGVVEPGGARPTPNNQLPAPNRQWSSPGLGQAARHILTSAPNIEPIGPMISEPSREPELGAGADPALILAQQSQAQPEPQAPAATAPLGTNPIDALASIGADTLRAQKRNNTAALLQNEALFNGGSYTG